MDEQFVNELAVALRKVGTIHTVGEEWHSYTGEIPVGGVPYCGQMVTRATYSALWKYAQEKYLVLDEANWQMYAEANGGNVPFYSSGDGGTTFRMPRIVGYVKGASSQSEAGTHLFEGLPNITGSLTTVDNFRLTMTGAVVERGALSASNNASTYFAGGTGSAVGVSAFNFDASRSSAIYGNSDHVTPETSVVMFGVYAFGAIVECGELDATTLATGLARLEANMPATPNAYIVDHWSNGTEWYRKYSDGWIEQGGTVGVGNNVEHIVTFPKAFSNTNYYINKNNTWWSDAAMQCMYINFYGKTTTSAKVYNSWVSNQGVGFTWYACGY